MRLLILGGGSAIVAALTALAISRRRLARRCSCVGSRAVPWSMACCCGVCSRRRTAPTAPHAAAHDRAALCRRCSASRSPSRACRAPTTTWSAIIYDGRLQRLGLQPVHGRARGSGGRLDAHRRDAPHAEHPRADAVSGGGAALLPSRRYRARNATGDEAGAGALRSADDRGAARVAPRRPADRRGSRSSMPGIRW